MNERYISVHKEMPRTANAIFSSDRKLVERFRTGVQCVAGAHAAREANCTHRRISDVVEVNAEIRVPSQTISPDHRLTEELEGRKEVRHSPLNHQSLLEFRSKLCPVTANELNKLPNSE